MPFYREVPIDCRTRAQDETSANLDMGHDQYNGVTDSTGPTSRKFGICFSAVVVVLEPGKFMGEATHLKNKL
jgi:hypothetical protein